MNSLSPVLCTITALLLSCCSGLPQQATLQQQKTALVNTLSRLPDGSMYEETQASFAVTLSKGTYWQSEDNRTEYLLIPGDGTCGERLFCMHPEQGLSVICLDTPEEDEEQVTASLYHYDGQQFNYVSTHPRAYWDNLLPANLPAN